MCVIMHHWDKTNCALFSFHMAWGSGVFIVSNNAGIKSWSSYFDTAIKYISPETIF